MANDDFWGRKRQFSQALRGYLRSQRWFQIHTHNCPKRDSVDMKHGGVTAEGSGWERMEGRFDQNTTYACMNINYF